MPVDQQVNAPLLLILRTAYSTTFCLVFYYVLFILLLLQLQLQQQQLLLLLRPGHAYKLRPATRYGLDSEPELPHLLGREVKTSSGTTSWPSVPA